MFKSLRFRLILIMFLVITIPMATLGIASLVTFTSSTEDSVKERLVDVTSLTAELIEAELLSSQLIGSTLSQDEYIIEYLRGDTAAGTRISTHLNRILTQNNGTVEMIAVADINGNVEVTHATANAGISVADRDYNIAALSSGQVSRSDVIVSKSTGVPIVAISSPIMDRGEVIGTVITTVSFQNIAKHIDIIKVFEEGYSFLLATDGTVLAHPNAELEFTTNMNDIGVPALSEMINEAARGESGEKFYRYDGVDKLVKFVPIDGFIVVVTANYNDYMASMFAVRNLVLIILISAIVISFVLSFFFVRKAIVKPLSTLQGLMKRAGKGDLTVQSIIDTGDEIQEIADAFNSMIDDQHEVVSKVRFGAVELSNASEDISESAQQISDSSENIASSITTVANNSSDQTKSIIETSEVLLQLSSLIQMAKSRAVQAEDNVRNSLEVADDGRRSVDNTIQAMENIESASRETREILGELEGLSTQVNGIIETINTIAEQTNMLALNASIEAARAGDHGRGFAVVAEEVRKLSEQTAEEADGINSVVGQMVKKINVAVGSMNSGYEAVQEGVVKAKDTDQSFVSILEAVNSISSDINKIVEVTDDEVSNSERILRLIESVSSLSETNSGNSEEVAAATQEQTALLETIASGSEELNAMAEELRALVERFDVKEA